MTLILPQRGTVSARSRGVPQTWSQTWAHANDKYGNFGNYNFPTNFTVPPFANYDFSGSNVTSSDFFSIGFVESYASGGAINHQLSFTFRNNDGSVDDDFSSRFMFKDPNAILTLRRADNNAQLLVRTASQGHTNQYPAGTHALIFSPGTPEQWDQRIPYDNDPGENKSVKLTITGVW